MIGFVAVVAAIAVCAVGLILHVRFVAGIDRLCWPDELEFYGMTKRTRVFFKRHGWRARRLDREQFFIADKSEGLLCVRCLPSHVVISEHKLGDIRIFKRETELKPFICVTANPVPVKVQEIAVPRRLYLIHYKDLEQITAIDKPSHKALEDVFAAHLQSRLQEPVDTKLYVKPALFDAADSRGG